MMRRLAPLAFLTAAALAAPVVAQMTMPTEAPGRLDPKRVVAGTYKFDPDHTQIVFTVNRLGFTEFNGMFANPTGTVTLDSKNPAAAKVEATIPIAKVRTTSPELDMALQKADFFDAAQFPTATFVSTKVSVAGTTATITGNLTLHGVTKPVTLKARFIGAGNEFWGDKKLAFGFAATTTIMRSQFGLTNSIPLVSDKVDLVINAGMEAQ
ncbi:polyisoprenoid-binding protein [Sphingomonas panacisoli]|uniref:Polyisoprenoid-binding protein n=1 Tax=Sphingomonas panacisoli TaxID=1813879 RepID=A0A5B8LHP0_9SPHN|nr:YceI family protein [Sphingomonas panacisoli]QDZ07376.1 polyisoprenoid-binding protein [Sphingomonas panacisoli]